MNISLYASAAVIYARFPAAPVAKSPPHWPRNSNIGYCTIGIIQEITEVLDASPETLAEELGDLWWFLALAANNTGANLHTWHALSQTMRADNPMRIINALTESHKLIRDGYSQHRSQQWANACTQAIAWAEHQRKAAGLDLGSVLKGNIDKLHTQDLKRSGVQ